MDEQKQKLIERIRQAQNILVTVSTNPSVDQLAAAIGLTLALNKLEKHGTAVFSGEVPSTIEFLKPEETLEKDTNSLRDFIIALDKSKADKLRYKVEDQVVRIFITPYKTSLSEADLNFSQGDFNVDVVIALGVTDQQDLDAAITAHGRILHDATVASVTLGGQAGQSGLGTINWADAGASSLSEMVEALVEGLDKKVIDNQIATALLTGIVASTERFSNEKTTPKTMSISSTLMAAGANQQLIATELATPPAPAAVPVQISDVTPPAGSDGAKHEPGMLQIEHESFAPATPEPTATESKPEPTESQIHVDDNGNLTMGADVPKISQVHAGGSEATPTEPAQSEVKRELLTEPPKMGDAEITASASPEDIDEPSAEELTLPAVQGPLLSHKETVLSPLPDPGAPTPGAAPASDASLPKPPAFQPAPPSWQPPASPATVPPITPAPTPVAAPVAPVAAVLAAPQPSLPPMPSLTPPAPTMPSTSTPAAAPQSHAAPVVSQNVNISEDGTFSAVPLPGDAPKAAATAPAPAAPADSTTPATGTVDSARDAVAAAFNSPTAPAPAPQPLAALNSQPLGPDLHSAAPAAGSITPAAPAVPNTGFSEPTPGNTPADSTLDMPLPSNPFGPGQQLPPSPGTPPPSAFPGAPAPNPAGPPPPPVPPPMVPPVQ